METELAKTLFSQMLEASAELDSETVERLLDVAKDSGLAFRLVDEAEEPEYDFETAGGGMMNVERTLYLGETVVTTWTASYSASYGGGGTGWWINYDDHDKPDGLDDLLDQTGLEEKWPDFPEPERGESEEDGA